MRIPKTHSPPSIEFLTERLLGSAAEENNNLIEPLVDATEDTASEDDRISCQRDVISPFP
jgi:hypothetical protein